MPNEKKEFIRSSDYHELFDVQIREAQDEEDKDEKKMIVEGYPVVFGQRTHLFTDYDGTEIYEIIDKDAFDNCDMSNCFLKYQHLDSTMPLARVKNGSMTLTKDEHGMKMVAELANTSAGRDLYELVRTGVLDKMSFAFTIAEESEDTSVEGEVTYTVRKIDHLFDCACVMIPAYEDTSIFARRKEDVETSKKISEERKLKAEELRLAMAKAGLSVK